MHGTGLDEVLLEIDDSNDVTYLHHDRIGSTIATTNDTGAVIDTYAYSPWGECDDMSGTTFGFQGQRFDHETGLYFMKARHYDPKIGRFLQPDPIGYGDGLNMYQFGYNNPNCFSDPLGLGADGSQGSSDTGNGADSSGSKTIIDYIHVLMGDPDFLAHTYEEGEIPGSTQPDGQAPPPQTKPEVYIAWHSVGTPSSHWPTGGYHASILVMVGNQIQRIYNANGVEGGSVHEGGFVELFTYGPRSLAQYQKDFLGFEVLQKVSPGPFVDSEQMIKGLSAVAALYQSSPRWRYDFTGGVLHGWNSNSLAYTLLYYAGANVPAPARFAPGWGRIGPLKVPPELA